MIARVSMTIGWYAQHLTALTLLLVCIVGALIGMYILVVVFKQGKIVGRIEELERRMDRED